MVTIVRHRGGYASREIDLVDSRGHSIAEVGEFLRFLSARGCSPNTLRAYAYDLAHLWRFLEANDLEWHGFAPRHAVDFILWLRTGPARGRVRIRGPILATSSGRPMSRPPLSPSTVNRILAAASSFYSWAMTAGHFQGSSPIARGGAPAMPYVTDRYRPFLTGISRHVVRSRELRLKTVRRLPRALTDDQVAALFKALRCQRDIALVHLMLDGGLRPGEALGLRLEDIQYGRRRVIVRHRNDHPRGARSKSRTERTVDLHEAATLEVVNRYVMTERPSSVESPYLFLIGGRGTRRGEALSYAALVRLFARACTRAGIREVGVSPHALRHTHATRMWEAGMRELTLQRRLGHASPESTRLYTRVSDSIVVSEYLKALGAEVSRKALRTGRSKRTHK